MWLIFNVRIKYDFLRFTTLKKRDESELKNFNIIDRTFKKFEKYY